MKLYRHFPLIVAAALALAATHSCTTIADLLRAPEALDATAMTEQEWIAWRSRQVARVEIVALGLYEDGALECADLDKAASWLAVMATGNPMEVGALTEALDVTGLKLAALKLALLELDGTLIDSGLYGSDGVLGPRGQELLVHVGNALEGVCDEG